MILNDNTYVDRESIYNRLLFEYVPTKKGKQTASPSLIRAAQHGCFPFCSANLRALALPIHCAIDDEPTYDVDLFRDLSMKMLTIVNAGQKHVLLLYVNYRDFLGRSNFVEQEAFIYFCERGIYFNWKSKQLIFNLTRVIGCNVVKI